MALLDCTMRTYDVMRFLGGIDESGIIKTSWSVIQVRGKLRAATPKELRNLPEGQGSVGPHYFFITQTQMIVGSMQTGHDTTIGNKSDRILVSLKDIPTTDPSEYDHYEIVRLDGDHKNNAGNSFGVNRLYFGVPTSHYKYYVRKLPPDEIGTFE